MHLFGISALSIRAVLVEIGSRLREERKRLGWTVNALAEKSGAALNSIRNYEAGSHSAKLELLLIFQDLGIDIGYVLTGRRSGAVTGEQEHQLLGRFVRLSPAEKDIVIALVGSMAGDEIVAADIDQSQKTLHSPSVDYRAKSKED